MDRNLIYPGAAIVMAGLLGFNWGKGGGGVHADDARPAAQEIAVVDLDKVFESHKGARGMLEQIQRDLERAEGELNAKRDECDKLKAELDAAKKGTADFQRIGQEFVKKFEAFKKLQGTVKQKFLESVAANQKTVYREINEEVTKIAESRGYRLVLSFTSESLDQKDPKKWMTILNNQVLYQNGLDITDDVISAFN